MHDLQFVAFPTLRQRALKIGVTTIEKFVFQRKFQSEEEKSNFHIQFSENAAFHTKIISRIFGNTKRLTVSFNKKVK